MQRQASARSRAIDSVQQLPLTAPPVAPDGWNVIICVAGTTFACAEVARAIEGILTNKMTASAAIQVRIVLPLILLFADTGRETLPISSYHRCVSCPRSTAPVGRSRRLCRPTLATEHDEPFRL